MYDQDDESAEVSLKWLEKEMQNHVGFIITLKTYEHDYISGRICGVRSGTVLLMDENKNRIGCDLGIIALYCIMNSKTNVQVKQKKLDAPAKKKKMPKAANLPAKAAEKKKKKKG